MMRHIPRVLFGGWLAAFALGAAGCENPTVDKVRKLAEDACACQDKACADGVKRRYRQLLSEGQQRGSEDDREAVAKAFERMTECIERAQP